MESFCCDGGGPESRELPGSGVQAGESTHESLSPEPRLPGPVCPAHPRGAGLPLETEGQRGSFSLQVATTVPGECCDHIGHEGKAVMELDLYFPNS